VTLGHAAQKALDTATIGAGLSAPWWVKAQFWIEYTTPWLGWIAAFFAALLAIGRFWAWVRGNGRKDG